MASFILLCIAALKLNLPPADRTKQFLMPVVTVIYCILALIFLNQIYLLLYLVINFLTGLIPLIGMLNLQQYLNYIVNAVLVLGFMAVCASDPSERVGEMGKVNGSYIRKIL